MRLVLVAGLVSGGRAGEQWWPGWWLGSGRWWVVGSWAGGLVVEGVGGGN